MSGSWTGTQLMKPFMAHKPSHKLTLKISIFGLNSMNPFMTCDPLCHAYKDPYGPCFCTHALDKIFSPFYQLLHFLGILKSCFVGLPIVKGFHYSNLRYDKAQ